MPIETIQDAADPRVADYRDLRDAALRRARGIFIAEGRPVVRRLLETPRFPVRSVLVTPAALEGLRDLLQPAGAGLPIYLAPEDLIRRIAGFNFHRGCLAAGDRAPETDPRAILAPPGPRLLVALEDLADPDNVGGIFRNAMAFGADGVLLSPGCADPLYRKAIRVSMGGVLRVPFARLRDWPRDLDALGRTGYTVVALTPRAGGADIAELGTTRPLPPRAVLLLGTEGSGLSPGARVAADLEVRIAMTAGTDSLNVATASGIALHHFRRPGKAAGDPGPAREMR